MLQNEQFLMKKRHEEVLKKLRDELNDSKEAAILVKKHEAVINVYKKKIDQMTDMKIELN